MPYSIKTLPKHSIILTTVTSPVIRGEASNVYRMLHEKIQARTDRETIHIVMNVTAFNYTNRFPIERFIKIIAKLYEDWHYRRTMILWFAADKSYMDMARYLVQTQCLPVYLRHDIRDVFRQIDAMYGETGSLQADKVQEL